MSTKIVLLLLLAGTVACHPPATVVTPQGQTAYTVDKIIMRVNELQNAAISANQQQGLDDKTTRLIVNFSLTANRAAAQSPAGFKPAVQAAWTSLKTQVPSIKNPLVAAAWNAVDTALATLGGQ